MRDHAPHCRCVRVVCEFDPSQMIIYFTHPFSNTPECMQQSLSVVVLLTVLVAAMLVDTPQRYPMYLLDDGTGNESLIVQGKMGDQTVQFLIDTAYAGAPVLSLSYLNCIRKDPRLVRRGMGVRTRFLHTMSALQQAMTNHEKHETINDFLSCARCRTYTSGCTMRLMGIGATAEAHSEMFLCPAVSLLGGGLALHRLWASQWNADVFVTHVLSGSPHILTSDYLLHRSPVLLEPRRGCLTFWTRARVSSFDFFPPVLVGGAFVIPILLGETSVHVVVDTGASTTVSISRAVARRLGGVCRSQQQTVQQTGVNGEKVCSDVVTTNITLGGTHLPGVNVLVNSQTVEGAEGYIGIGVLRAFDMYVSHNGIGFRANGMDIGTLPAVVEGTCDGIDVCKQTDEATVKRRVP